MAEILKLTILVVPPQPVVKDQMVEALVAAQKVVNPAQFSLVILDSKQHKIQLKASSANAVALKMLESQ